MVRSVQFCELQVGLVSEEKAQGENGFSRAGVLYTVVTPLLGATSLGADKSRVVSALTDVETFVKGVADDLGANRGIKANDALMKDVFGGIPPPNEMVAEMVKTMNTVPPLHRTDVNKFTQEAVETQVNEEATKIPDIKKLAALLTTPADATVPDAAIVEMINSLNSWIKDPVKGGNAKNSKVTTEAIDKKKDVLGKLGKETQFLLPDIQKALDELLAAKSESTPVLDEATRKTIMDTLTKFRNRHCGRWPKKASKGSSKTTKEAVKIKRAMQEILNTCNKGGYPTDKDFLTAVTDFVSHIRSLVRLNPASKLKKSFGFKETEKLSQKAKDSLGNTVKETLYTVADKVINAELNKLQNLISTILLGMRHRNIQKIFANLAGKQAQQLAPGADSTHINQSVVALYNSIVYKKIREMWNVVDAELPEDKKVIVRILEKFLGVNMDKERNRNTLHELLGGEDYTKSLEAVLALVSPPGYLGKLKAALQDPRNMQNLLTSNQTMYQFCVEVGKTVRGTPHEKAGEIMTRLGGFYTPKEKLGIPSVTPQDSRTLDDSNSQSNDDSQSRGSRGV